MTTQSVTPEQLIQQSQRLVFSIANKIHSRMPSYVSIEDVVSYGQLGLAQAARSYKPDSGVAFSTFAYYRIRGAIYDGMSKMSWSTRAHAAKLQAMRNAEQVLQDDVDRPQNDNAKEEAAWLIGTTEKLAVVFLAASLRGEGESEDSIVDERAERPDKMVEDSEVAKVLSQAIANLSEVERKIVEGLYYQNLSITEVATSLGKSKSWACRYHQRILQHLCSALKQLGVDAD
jgi:RNA polymerase sigma factor FliA